MKKASIMVVIMAIIFSACSNNQNNEEGRYNFLNALWPFYESAEELMNASSYVFVARITGISFVVLDVTTALPPTENTEDRHRGLNTFYELEIYMTFKGCTLNVTHFWVDGGLRGYRTDEQIRLMEEYQVYNRDWGIPVWESPIYVNVGDVFLLALNEYFYPLNLSQGILSLDEPIRYQIGNTAFTAKDVISEFGRSAWDSFESQWQRGDFESRR